MDIDGDRLVIGAPAALIVSAATAAPSYLSTQSGSAYIYRYDGSAWVFEQKLVPVDGPPFAEFGRSVSISGNTLVVGVPRDDHPGEWSGSARVYDFDGSTWAETQELSASDSAPGDEFGFDVSIDGDIVVVGSPFNDHAGTSSGAAYVFRKVGGVWLQEQKLIPSNAATEDFFGAEARTSAGWVIVSSAGRDAVHFFQHDGSTWQELQTIEGSDVGELSGFGASSIAIDGDFLLVGTPGNDDAAMDAGVVYVFRFDGSMWQLEHTLYASDAQAGDRFGSAVALDGALSLIAAWGDDRNLPGSGSAHIYRYDGSAWVFEQEMAASGTHPGDFFGYSVSISGEKALVGAFFDSTTIDYSGSAYEFDLTLSSPLPAAAEQPPLPRNRFLSLSPGNSGQMTAFRVKLLDLQNPSPPNVPQHPPPDFSSYEYGAGACSASNETALCTRWLGRPIRYLESRDNPSVGSFTAARLQCTPYYYDWGSLGIIHVIGAEILPSSAYEVQVISQGCNASDEGSVSAPLIVTTARHGDVTAPFNPPSDSQQPEGVDVAAQVYKFKNLPGALSKTSAQLQPNLPSLNADVDALDIAACVDAFKGFPYPFSGPCPCPPTVPCEETSCASSTVCVSTYGPGSMCVRTCESGPKTGEPCAKGPHCGSCSAGSAIPGLPCDESDDCSGGSCDLGDCPPDPPAAAGFCRDRCGRCSP